MLIIHITHIEITFVSTLFIDLCCYEILYCCYCAVADTVLAPPSVTSHAPPAALLTNQNTILTIIHYNAIIASPIAAYLSTVIPF